VSTDTTALDQRVAEMVRKGWRVEHQSQTTATLVKGKKVNHVLHAILSVFTLAIWALVVWLPLTIKARAGSSRRVLTVENGVVSEQRAGGAHKSVRQGN
jgi:hypothetical protein